MKLIKNMQVNGFYKRLRQIVIFTSLTTIYLIYTACDYNVCMKKVATKHTLSIQIDYCC